MHKCVGIYVYIDSNDDKKIYEQDCLSLKIFQFTFDRKDSTYWMFFLSNCNI